MVWTRWTQREHLYARYTQSDNAHKPLLLPESFKRPEFSAVGSLSRDIPEAQYMDIMQIQPLIRR
jgi:hypothetical protein